jgi:arylsulfatase A-like enzyme
MSQGTKRALGAVILAALLAGCTCSSSTEPPPPEPKAAKVKRAKGEVKPEAATPKPPLNDALKAAPNVLLIVWDTVRADHMSAYGYNKPTTPRIAAWSKQGVRYDRAVSAGVWTLPSHASLFTGLPERAHGVNADYNWLDSEHLTVAEAMGSAGYDTWTFCANPYLAQDTNLLQGFEKKEFPWAPRWREKVEAHMKSKILLDDASTPVSPQFKGKGGSAGNKYLFKEAGPLASDALFEWLGSRPESDRPFFAFVNYMEAHLPRIPRLESRQQVMNEAEMARALQVEQSTTFFHEWMVGVRKYDPLDLAAIAGVYDASLIDLDQATGLLLDELDRRGLAEDTIVILTSDHGEHLGDHDLLLHKYAVYNSLVRVPLLVVWKGHMSPQVITEPKSVSDVVLDALELGKVPVAAADLAKLRGRPNEGFDGAVAEYGAVADGSIDRMKRLHPEANTARLERKFEAVESGPWKYIEASDGSRELFQVLDDPNETRELGALHPAVVAELQRRLALWREKVPAYQATKEGEGHKRTGELKEGLEALGYVE